MTSALMKIGKFPNIRSDSIKIEVKIESLTLPSFVVEKRQHKKMKSIGKFLDIEAEEASDLDEDEFDEEEHDFIKKKQQENQFYAEGELAKRHTGLNRDFLDGMANRYKDL